LTKSFSDLRKNTVVSTAVPEAFGTSAGTRTAPHRSGAKLTGRAVMATASGYDGRPGGEDEGLAENFPGKFWESG
jgi:hypothetical protein